MAAGIVVTYAPADDEPAGGHMSVTREAIARALATLNDFDFGGEYHAATRYGAALYFVPKDTLVGTETARALGIRREEDLYGGVVPFPFVGNKTIVHPLVAPDARTPEGWSHAFAERVRDLVLPGFSAFALEDAFRAGRRLLERGAVRMKLGQGLGGHGQTVIARVDELDAALDTVAEAELERHGLVMEEDLTETTTFSVGQVRVAGLLATYCGTQHMTTDNRGGAAYGGSELLLVRGGFEHLERRADEPEVRLAIAQARAFDAATAEFPGLFASRRNYDIVRGRTADGRWRCGVLEQSWRIGGASGAEVGALAAFRADAALNAVRARSTEVYGAHASAPPGAVVHYRGVDAQAGPLLKYSLVEAYDARR